MNEGGLPTWLVQQWVSLIGALLVTLVGFLIRAWWKHVDICLDALRKELHVRIAVVDRLEEWRLHRDKEDDRWHAEWVKHLERLDLETRTDQERRHVLGDQIQGLMNRLYNLEREQRAKEIVTP